jgi:hypothetical protein
MKTAAFRRAAPRALSKTLAQDMSRLMRAALCDAVLNTDAVDGAALLIEPAPQPLAPARLASGQPGDAAARGRARAMYERCLANYRAAARAADGACGLDDVGVAIAHFVAANMRALHDVQITPDMCCACSASSYAWRSTRRPGTTLPRANASFISSRWPSWPC